MIKTAAVKLCGRGMYQIKTKKFNLDELEKKLRKIGKVKRLSRLLHFKELTIFENRVLIKADDEKKAHTIYSK